VSRAATLTVFAAEHADPGAVAGAAQRLVDHLVDILAAGSEPSVQRKSRLTVFAAVDILAAGSEP
jgi:hypothetical protein